MLDDLKNLFPEDFREYLRVAFLIVLAIFIGSLLWHTGQSATALTAPKASPSRPADLFAGINLEAKAALVYDINSGKVIFEKNKDEILPIASITKIMTAYTALSLVPPDTVITIRPEDVAEVGESGLIAGEQWRLQDLIEFMLVSSSNDAASAVAAGVEKETQLNFVLAMNNSASTIGLPDTRFRNPSGLDEYANAISGSFSTASDISKMFAYLYKHQPAIFSGTNQAYLEIYSLAGNKHAANNTNSAVNQIASLVASKTGTTELAGGNLAIIFKPIPDKPVAVVVLGSSPAGRFTDMLRLTKATVSQLSANKI